MRTFKKGFTLVEAIVVLIMLGIIAALCIKAIKSENFNQQALQTKADKELSNITEIMTMMLTRDVGIDDFTILKDATGQFSITDENITSRVANLIKKYYNVDSAVPIDMTNEYFTGKLLDHDKTEIADLKDTYSDFFYTATGTLVGFRTYQSCEATEENASPPKATAKFAVEGICMSIFYDVNGEKKPNKLGADQYIIPIYKRGIKMDSQQ